VIELVSEMLQSSYSHVFLELSSSGETQGVTRMDFFDWSVHLYPPYFVMADISIVPRQQS